MNSRTPNENAVPEKFRANLFAAMMIVVFAVTTGALYLAQKNAESADREHLNREFRNEFASLLAAQEVQLAAITERCRTLAHSVRILAALEENDVQDLYLNARIELRDVLQSARNGDSDSRLLRADFFCFLNASGGVMPSAQADGKPMPEPWQSQLAMPGISDRQQTGFITTPGNDGGTRLLQIIATPLASTDTGEVIGAIVLGFRPDDFEMKNAGSGIISGIWFNNRLHSQALDAKTAAKIAAEIGDKTGTPGSTNESFKVDINGVPYMLFGRALNPESKFAPALRICLYPLTDSLARQRRLRWKIISLGALVLLFGLIASHFLSTRFSRPVAQLAADSAQNLEQRTRIEAKLELTYDELRIRNTELQNALAGLQAAQQQVIQQERLRALGQMASGIAHDFNNALVPIIGFCELLQMNPAIWANREKSAQYLDTIQTAANDAANIVKRLREVYRPTEKKENIAPVDLNRLVEQCINLTRPKWKDQVQAGGATISVVSNPGEVPPIAGNESALREMLTNLIFNAVDAMPQGGTVTLRTRFDGEMAVLEIADTGTGMSEEVRQHCLEPFFSTKGERGTGLGLSMVFGIVQRHGGTIHIQSVQGKGTTFVVRLPLQPAVDSQPAVVPAAESRTPLRVLVVDDEPQVRDLLGAALAHEGHEVSLANEGSEGLRRFIEGRYDLLVTDQAMPGMSGDQLAREIKLRSPKTPVILLTGFGEFLDKQQFPDVDFLVSKPIGIPALRATIAEAMQTA